MRVGGLTFPGRFRFTHKAGHDYRHYIEATFLGFPILKVNESYLDGNSRLELPYGVTEGETKIAHRPLLALAHKLVPGLEILPGIPDSARGFLFLTLMSLLQFSQQFQQTKPSAAFP